MLHREAVPQVLIRYPITITGTGGCADVVVNTPVIITAVPTGIHQLAGTPFCKSVATAQAVTLTEQAPTQVVHIALRQFNNECCFGSNHTSTSTAGTYTVTYTIPASSGCLPFPVTTSVIITAVPTAAINYAGSPFCSSLATPQPVTLTGTGAYTGGTYSSAAG